jgi:hypothetical protein
LAWLSQGWHTQRDTALTGNEPEPSISPLTMVRFEFIGALDDIPTPQAADLAGRIRHARSLRELWHLRAEVFSVVSRHGDEAKATARLSQLNRHFPTRAARSSFGGFDAVPRSSQRN